jgi:hypothetical protein
MHLKRKLVVPVLGLLAVGGIGTGVAVAQSGPGPDSTNPPAGGTQVEQGDQPDAQDGPGDVHEKGDKEEKDGKETDKADKADAANEGSEAPTAESTPAPR